MFHEVFDFAIGAIVRLALAILPAAPLFGQRLSASFVADEVAEDPVKEALTKESGVSRVPYDPGFSPGMPIIHADKFSRPCRD
jgi:hypothetical protein